MPKKTFLHLSEEKRKRIMKAAKKEFARVPLNDASIAQIIKDAEIPRGSFYQYFEDKEDLYFYCIKSLHRDVQKELVLSIQEASGNLFDGFQIYFSKMVDEILYGENATFYKTLFMNLDYGSFHKLLPYFNKKSQHVHRHEHDHKEYLQEFYNSIDLSVLKITSKEEFEMLLKMLMHQVFSTVAEGYRQLSKDENYAMDQVTKDFSIKLNWIKNGVAITEGQTKSIS
ncbi:MAG: TetR/AcrR family transcriptional regulator [Enterococcus sp.]